MTDDQNKSSAYMTFGIYGASGFQLAIAVIVGLWGGSVLDRKLGTNPWFSLIGLALGFGGGLWNLIRILNWHRDRNS